MKRSNIALLVLVIVITVTTADQYFIRKGNHYRDRIVQRIENPIRDVKIDFYLINIRQGCRKKEFITSQNIFESFQKAITNQEIKFGFSIYPKILENKTLGYLNLY